MLASAKPASRRLRPSSNISESCSIASSGTFCVIIAGEGNNPLFFLFPSFTVTLFFEWNEVAVFFSSNFFHWINYWIIRWPILFRPYSKSFRTKMHCDRFQRDRNSVNEIPFNFTSPTPRDPTSNGADRNSVTPPWKTRGFFSTIFTPVFQVIETSWIVKPRQIIAIEILPRVSFDHENRAKADAKSCETSRINLLTRCTGS